MELMSSVLEVSISEIKETVKRDRCDWLAAIYNLLLDYPDGRMAVQKMLSDDRSQSVGSSQESLNGVSGFSQGLSQGGLTVWLGISCCHGNILSCVYAEPLYSPTPSNTVWEQIFMHWTLFLPICMELYLLEIL